MIPRSLSATSLTTASLCLSRYNAEHILRGKGAPGEAALAGSAAHGGLEYYVKAVYITKTHEPSLDLLLEFYKLSYVEVFESTDYKTVHFKEGVAMLKAWFARNSLEDATVLSCEIKESFEVPTSIGNIPFNYIWDRCDDLGNGVIKVVDYKTNRWGLTPADLRDKPQARCYALAAQIKFPDAKLIWVEFDMLRHDGPVGVSYTKEDNIETWRWIRREAERIISTPNDKPVPETLNPECNFCARKTTCGSLMRNVKAGGVLSFGDAASMADRRAELEYQKKAIASAIQEMDEVILAEFRTTGSMEAEGEETILVPARSKRREVDADRVFQVVGPTLFAKYSAGAVMKMGDFDALVKDPELDPETKKRLFGLVFVNTGEPRVSVKKKATIR